MSMACIYVVLWHCRGVSSSKYNMIKLYYQQTKSLWIFKNGWNFVAWIFLSKVSTIKWSQLYYSLYVPWFIRQFNHFREPKMFTGFISRSGVLWTPRHDKILMKKNRRAMSHILISGNDCCQNKKV